MREGLASLIMNDFKMTIVGQAETGSEAIRLSAEIKPQLVLMDVSMPDINGIEATRLILQQQPSIKIIGLSMHADKRYIMEMMTVGAAGYLLKHSAADELEWAIKEVLRGHRYISPAITGIVLSEFSDGKNSSTNSKNTVETNGLTLREREVLMLLAEGKTSKEIATLLNLSVKTTESHRTNIMSKLGLFSIAELTKYAIREGLTPLEN